MSASEQTAEAKAIADEAPLVAKPNLAVALVAALAELTVVEAARTATVEMKQGGSYSYKYADIADVVKLTRPVLHKHGLVALTPIHDHGDGLACSVVLVHTSGECMELGPFPFPHGRDAQATGSMVTYHRRYALIAALGMAAGEDDDDGAGAHRRRQEPTMSVAAKALYEDWGSLTPEVADDIKGRAEAKAGAPWLDLLEVESWRTWVSQAIEHHRKSEAGS